MKTGIVRHPVMIGEIIQNAVVFDFKKWRNSAVNTADLLQSVSRLFQLLTERQVEYLLVGGVALLQYVEGRNTEDIDLILDPTSLEKLPEIKISAKDDDFARGTYGSLRIDILQTRNPLFDKVRRAYAVTQHFKEQDIPCATVEGLLLLKMHALPSLYRQGSFARVGLYENDIATLLHDYEPSLDPLFDELEPHLSATALCAVREIVDEIRERIARFQKGRKREK